MSELFSAADVDLLDEIAETILPATDTPGAKAAQVGQFMSLMVADTYRANQQQIVLEGLRDLTRDCVARFGHSFIDATAGERTELLERLDREQFASRNEAGDRIHYFRLLKELALQGYFTSEIGYTEAMRYVESPGRFDPCVPYAVGDRAWADHA